MPKTRDAFAFEKWYECLKITVGINSVVVTEEANENLKKGFIGSVESDGVFEKAIYDSNLKKHKLKKLRFLEHLCFKHTSTLRDLKLALADEFAETSDYAVSDGAVSNSIKKLKSMIFRVNDLDAKYWRLYFRFFNLKELYETNPTAESFKTPARKQFGSRLKQARINKKISATSISKILGITQQGYSKYETGESEPPIVNIWTLAKILDVSADWLIGVTNIPPEEPEECGI